MKEEEDEAMEEEGVVQKMVFVENGPETGVEVVSGVMIASLAVWGPQSIDEFIAARPARAEAITVLLSVQLACKLTISSTCFM